MYENIRERYLRYYIRDDQLERYVQLGVISGEQAEALKLEKSSGGGLII